MKSQIKHFAMSLFVLGTLAAAAAFATPTTKTLVPNHVAAKASQPAAAAKCDPATPSTDSNTLSLRNDMQNNVMSLGSDWKRQLNYGGGPVPLCNPFDPRCDCSGCQTGGTCKCTYDK